MGKPDPLAPTSKFLSLVLRHQPEAIGLQLAADGWAQVDELIQLANANGQTLTRELVAEVVRSSDKQRFALSEDGQRIRANQGHSVAVELGLQAVVPPELLFHGTATRFVEAIEQQGLLPMARQHVHLSVLRETAVTVGQRHGSPVVLQVRARAMHDAGFRFYLSANGVWLTDRVPPEYLSR